MWDYNEPNHADEKPATDEWRPHRRRKNTRKWCRGKEGTPHNLVIKLGKVGTRRSSTGAATCFWWRWGTPHWSCGHEESCANCGKILRYGLPSVECPHYVVKGEE